MTTSVGGLLLVVETAATAAADGTDSEQQQPTQRDSDGQIHPGMTLKDSKGQPINDLLDTLILQQQHQQHRQQQQPQQHQRPKQTLPIRLCQMPVVERYDPLQYGAYGGVGGAGRFLAVQQHQQQPEHRDDSIIVVKTMVSMRRCSCLALFFLTLWQFIQMDSYCSILPFGVLLYSISLQIAWEQWMTELENNRLYELFIQQERQTQLMFDEVIRFAQFDYHVMRNRWDMIFFVRTEFDSVQNTKRRVLYATSQRSCKIPPEEFDENR